jgi:hypothetical protein
MFIEAELPARTTTTTGSSSHDAIRSAGVEKPETLFHALPKSRNPMFRILHSPVYRKEQTTINPTCMPDIILLANRQHCRSFIFMCAKTRTADKAMPPQKPTFLSANRGNTAKLFPPSRMPPATCGIIDENRQNTYNEGERQITLRGHGDG